MSEAPVELRVGDRERRAADDLLQAAVGDGVLTLAEYDERSAVLWQARTRTDVQALLADLPDPSAPAAPVPCTGPVRSSRVLAIMSEDRVSGPVVPGQEVSGWSLMGKAVVDLRRADLPDDLHVRVGTLMGEVEVQVPPGTDVRLSGMAVMGQRSVRVAPGGGPVVHVAAYALMGQVSVTVGDGSVAPAGPPAQRTGHLSGHHPARPPARAVAAQRPPEARASLARRAARRASGIGLTGALVLGGLGVVAFGTDQGALFGSAVEQVSGDESSVSVSPLFGSIEVVVPDDARVDTGGLVVFGSVSCKAACSTTNRGEVVDVRSYGAFGSVSIKTQEEFDQENAEDGRPDLDPPD